MAQEDHADIDEVVCRAAWAVADTLEALGKLTASWLEGGITFYPLYDAPGPDPETKDLVPALATMNRAGFVTCHSQPGQPWRDEGAQRACVSGFCTVEVAETIAAGCLRTDLVCLVHWPGAEPGAYIPVTIDEDRAYTWDGMGEALEDIVQNWAEHGFRRAAKVLIDSWQVSVIDPVWGRNDLLWPTVVDALARGPATGALPPWE